MSYREQPILCLSFELIIGGGLFLVFLNVVTPVFILVVIGYFIGPRLKIEARSLSRTAYFVLHSGLCISILSVKPK